MLATLSAVFPVFALIFLSWLARRFGVVGPQATGEFSRFVMALALPALLFDIVANASLAELWRPGFAGAFGLGAALTYAATLALRLRGRPLADAALDGLNACYANVGFVGFPLALATFGREALALTLIASLITVCVLFAIGVVLIEAGLHSGARPLGAALKVAGALARNPLLIAPVLGAAFPLFSLSVPPALEGLIKLTGAAASPCALAALGFFLADREPGGRARPGVVAALVGMKLIVQPAVTYALAAWVFGLSPPLTHTAVLLAALPTGTGTFMLAEIYGRDADMTSRVVLISTVLSVVTLSLYLALPR